MPQAIVRHTVLAQKAIPRADTLNKNRKHMPGYHRTRMKLLSRKSLVHMSSKMCQIYSRSKKLLGAPGLTTRSKVRYYLYSHAKKKRSFSCQKKARAAADGRPGRGRRPRALRGLAPGRRCCRAGRRPVAGVDQFVPRKMSTYLLLVQFCLRECTGKSGYRMDTRTDGRLIQADTHNHLQWGYS